MNKVSKNNLKLLGIAFLPAFLTLLCYLPLLSNNFINWDDPQFILNNPLIQSLNRISIQRMFTTLYEANWMPLSWISLALDYHIGGLDPHIYHFHAIILHTFNTLWVFFISVHLFQLVSQRMDIKSSGKEDWIVPAALFSSILFGLHPLHVESVAWAAERRDLLCGFYFLAALWVYLEDAHKAQSWKRWFCLILFAFALLSKPMAVTFPLVLLLLDAWPLGRLENEQRGKVILEKLPFLVISMAAGLLTIYTQSIHGAFQLMQDLPFCFKLTNAFHSIFFYLWKMVFPVSLAVFYPLLYRGQISLENVFTLFLVLGFTLVCFKKRLQKPYLMVTWLYFCLTLLPVLGLLQTGTQAAADRFTYIPSLGPFLLCGALAGRSFERRKFIFLLLILSIILGWGTLTRIRVWKNSISLWENELNHYPVNSELAHTNLANAYGDAGRLPDALREFDQSISIGPPDGVAYNGKGVVLFQMGRAKESIPEFQTAIALEPKFDAPHIYLCRIFQMSKQLNEALNEAQIIVTLDPENARAFDLLGMCYGNLDRPKEALEAFQKALILNPGNPLYLNHIALIRQQAEKQKEKK